MKSSDIKKLGMLYEAHFYHEMNQDQQNQYYTIIRQGIDPFAKKCHDLAIQIDQLKNEIESLFYTDEWNELKPMIEAYTENPNLEIRDIQGYLVDIISNLNHSADRLSKENIISELTDILTGQKIQ